MNTTEREIIKAVFMSKAIMCTSYDIAVPNCYTSHDNEADLFFIRKSGICDEVEVKVSRSDLLADSKKIVSYRDCVYTNTQSNEFTEDRLWIDSNFNIPSKDRKKLVAPWQKLKCEALLDGDMPANYFWYAIKEGIGGVEDIPDFAGLIIVASDGEVKIWRRPKKLHRNKMSSEDKYLIARKASYRYWKSEFGIGF